MTTDTAETAAALQNLDILLTGAWNDPDAQALLLWARHGWEEGLHRFIPDFHRLQLEHWLWSHRHDMQGLILDIGAENPRRWLGDGYVTFGEAGCDLTGDICRMALADRSVDVILCTEVLEHCIDPPAAMREFARVMRPGGRIFISAPFLWPWHGKGGEYKDYWRFTHQAWEYLLRDWREVTISPCAWTNEGAALYDLLRRFEGWGFDSSTEGTMGYQITAVR